MISRFLGFSLLAIFSLSKLLHADTTASNSPDQQVLCICDQSLNCGVYVNPESKKTFHLSLDEQDTTFPKPPQDNCAMLQSNWLNMQLVRVTKDGSDHNPYYANPSIPFVNHVTHEFLYDPNSNISASFVQDKAGYWVIRIINYALPNGGEQIIQPEPFHPETVIRTKKIDLIEQKGIWNLQLDFYNDKNQLKHLIAPIDLAKINTLHNTVKILNLNTTPNALQDQESFAYTATGEVHDAGSYGWHVSLFSMENDNWATQSIDCGSPCRVDNFIRFYPYSLTSFENDNDSSLDYNIILYDGSAGEQNAEIVSRITDPSKAVVVPLINTNQTYPMGVFGSGENGFTDKIDDQGVHITYIDDDNKMHHVFVSYPQIDQAHYNPNQSNS